MTKLLDIVRPGVSLLDDSLNVWIYVGKLTPDDKTLERVNLKASMDGLTSQKWEDKWAREDGEGETFTIEEVWKNFGPISVYLEQWKPDLAWYNRKDTFSGPKENESYE